MKRTSTSWDFDDDNYAKSYAVLHNRTSVGIPRPKLGKGTLMEAAGGVKSTIEDLTLLYTAYLRTIIFQFSSDSDSSPDSILQNCRTLVTNHARFPGVSLREQGYGAGWARSQLPGQLGRVSGNILILDEAVVGKGTESALVLYHHGSMPGSTSCVLMLPESETFVIVLQNSLAPIDTADFVGQFLVETLLNAAKPNDYKSLAKEFTTKSLNHMTRLKNDLDRHQVCRSFTTLLQQPLTKISEGSKELGDVGKLCREILEQS